MTEILKSTTQDPTPLLSLTIKLLSPLSFTRTLTIADPPSLEGALRSPLPGANLLALAIIRKAAKAPSDASILSTLPEVVGELITRWLETSDVGVGERAGKVIGDLLETDCELVGGETPSPLTGANGIEVVKRRVAGHGRLWRLILLSLPNLTTIESFCKFGASGPGNERRSVHQITISQGRLLRLLPRLATLNLGILSTSVLPDGFRVPATLAASVGEGLMQWAALAMVDKSDILMRLSLVDFFETIVSVMRVSPVSADMEDFTSRLVKAALRGDDELATALRTLPDRTVEEEAESLRRYIAQLLN